eukprot:4786383-Amphidinium_carterae.1
MKAHQSDKDAEEGCVGRADQQECKQWSTVCQAVRNFWLTVGPKLRARPEHWPKVRLPAPEPEPEVVEMAKKVEFPAAPFVIGPHQRVVEHETKTIVSIVRDTRWRTHWAATTMPSK